MKKSLVGAMAILWLGVAACTNQNNSDAQTKEVDTTVNQEKKDMKNLVSIVEIPASDFQRAVSFYEAILDIKIEVIEMEGIEMGMFPDDGEGIAVQIIHGGGYKTSGDGTIVYLNCGDNLQKVADKIEASGGKILVPRTEIGPEMGFYGMFTDTEGNKLGLHASN